VFFAIARPLGMVRKAVGAVTEKPRPQQFGPAT
jgi:hypothetical protein